jgi:class 3 adenylate cyclase
MISERLSVSGASVWPDLEDESPVTCAVLFIDIRGSSEMSAQRNAESKTVAARTRAFLKATQELWSESKVQHPTSVRSVGDGLLCVWEMSRSASEQRQLREAILEEVLELHRELPERVAKSERSAPIRFGMGLAHGDAAVALIGNNTRDYYGYVVNLAAKLQDFARPCGVVIERSFAQEIPIEDKLDLRTFDLAMAPRGIVECFVTPEVQHVYRWTCLAWPGFAVGHGENVKGGNRNFGLNAMGITVLTHEGLRGKIGSLAIWPRNDLRQKPQDEFDLIIDDFDSLSEMNAEKAIALQEDYTVGRSHSNRENSVALALSERARSADFYFMPIRCGLNALAWHVCEKTSAIAKATSYREVVELAVQHRLKIAIYDNLGVTLPILLNAVHGDQLDVFEADASDFEDLTQWLTEQQARLSPNASRHDQKLFVIHDNIQRLALALQAGTIHVVLGGGAWLANPQYSSTGNKVACTVPENSLGFLWIEGAAMLRRNSNDTENLRKFLSSTVLDYDYQKALLQGVPYGSSPVSKSLVKEILETENLDRSATDAEKITLAETRRIFESEDKLRNDIIVRRRPDRPTVWNRAWNDIRDVYSKKLT